MRWQRETVIEQHKTDLGAGMAVLRSRTPRAWPRRCGRCSRVYRAFHTLIGAAVDATGIPPDEISFPHALAAASDSVAAGFPTHQTHLARPRS